MSGIVPYKLAECYTLTLADGATTYRWTTYDRDVELNLEVFTCQNPHLKRSKWSLTNTMQVPSMTVTLLSTTTAFAGGLDIRSRIAQGFLDGASFLLTNVYIDAVATGFGEKYPVILGDIPIFGGSVSTAQIGGTSAVIMVKGANNKLDQNAPRRVYQIGCNNTFCDAGCTLDRNAFTFPFAVGASPTRSFIPWATPPGDPSLFQLGTVTMTSGPASGQAMTVEAADASGLTLVFPLYNTPEPGDTFDAFEGCNKTVARCDSRGNTQNGLWFPFIPAAETAF
jgi:hypothetical protein